MNWAYIVFVVLSMSLLVLVVIRPNRIIEYPFVLGLTFGVGLLPQLYGLQFSPIVSEAMLADVNTMTCLCLCGSLLGYVLPFGKKRAMGWSGWKFSEQRLLTIGWLLVVIGVVSNVLIGLAPEDERSRTQWTGSLTKYAFFARLALPGFALCLHLWLRRRWRWALVGSLVGLAYPAMAVLFGGRREPAGQIALTFAILYVIDWRRRIPRAAVVAAIVVGVIVIPSIGEYRVAVARTDPITAMKEFDISRAWNDRLEGESGTDVRNAAFLIAAAKSIGEYEYGRGFWNAFVFSFVPAQFVGDEVKEALMLRDLRTSSKDERMWSYLGYEPHLGTTYTGVGDSFAEFGYFGSLLFVGQGIFFRWMYESVMRSENVAALLFYIGLIVAAIIGVTHQLSSFPVMVVYYVVFLGFPLLWARRNRG